jgi:hypothetical protein
LCRSCAPSRLLSPASARWSTQSERGAVDLV